jgi:hypothetical protein
MKLDNEAGTFELQSLFDPLSTKSPSIDDVETHTFNIGYALARDSTMDRRNRSPSDMPIFQTSKHFKVVWTMSTSILKWRGV